ncbi:MAG: nuclear transport factor 2 family protein [Flavobacteriales bacterium]|nr:nuclear transport factor 2 family protein [Flavobacteriales bacterium]
MKIKPLLLATIIATSTTSFACNSTHSNDTHMIEIKGESTPESVLLAYLKAGDESNVESINELTHKNYRVIFNDLSKNSVSEIDKSSYLDLIRKKVFGGKPRSVNIKSIDITGGNIASIKVNTSSDGASFNSYFSLIKDQGKWYILQDLIYMENN